MTRLLPPALFLLLLLLIGIVWQFEVPAFIMRPDAAMPWDIPLIIGAAFLIWARVHFLRRSAEIHTFRRPGLLVTDGPFRFSRNPMYLGFFLLLAAAAFFVNSWLALIAPLAFLLVTALFYIPYEERTLQDAFGAQYLEYTSKVRRWI